MGTVVLDSSVLLGLADSSDALHDAAKEALRVRHNQTKVVPAVVFAEIMVRALGFGDRTAERIEHMVDQLASEVHPIDREIARAAAEIRARRSSLLLPDALVLATGQVLDAEVLTADKAWKGEPGRITVLEA
jgi:PIN domain nuclease of toxin-antitoxin system